ncbi:MAG: hypothetical protein ACFE9M_11975 [Promethearchaeota archaeon]
MRLVCQDCKYEQTVQDRSLKQCPKCGSSNIRIFLFGSASKSTQGLIVIFLIGVIFMIGGVISFYYGIWTAGITLIVIGIILLAIGSKGEICWNCSC